MVEEREALMRDDLDPGKGDIAALLLTRHGLHAKADFEFRWSPGLGKDK